MSLSWPQKVRRFLLVIGSLAIVAGALHYVFDPSHLERYTEMEVRLEKVRQMNRGLERDNRRLLREIDACRSDPRYLLRHARRELRAVRDGQLVYQFPPLPPKTL